MKWDVRKRGHQECDLFVAFAEEDGTWEGWKFGGMLKSRVHFRHVNFSVNYPRSNVEWAVVR